MLDWSVYQALCHVEFVVLFADRRSVSAVPLPLFTVA